MAGEGWARLLAELRQDNRSGATALTRRAAAALPSLAEGGGERLHDCLRKRVRALAMVRPPFGSLARLADQTATAVAGMTDRASIGQALAGVGREVEAALAAQHAAVVEAARPLLPTGARVLTISASSLVRDALLDAAANGRTAAVTCLESRPGREGAAQARELARAGLRVRLAADAAAASLVDETDLVLVGGDTLSPAGLVHKLGTLGLALAAARRRVPCYALLGSLKMVPAPIRGWRADGGPVAELEPAAGSAVEVWNGYFDLTPLELLAGAVLETGLVGPAAAGALAAGHRLHPWLADLLEA